MFLQSLYRHGLALESGSHSAVKKLSVRNASKAGHYNLSFVSHSQRWTSLFSVLIDSQLLGPLEINSDRRSVSFVMTSRLAVMFTAALRPAGKPPQQQPAPWRVSTDVCQSSPITSASRPGEPGAPGAQRVHAPRVIVWRGPRERLPRGVTADPPALSRFRVPVRVVLRYGARVGALLGLRAREHAVRVRGVHRVHLRLRAPDPLVAVREALERHRVPLGQEERAGRHVAPRGEGLPRALQVQQDPAAPRVVHVLVSLQQPVGEEAAVPVADGLHQNKHHHK